VQGHEQLRAFLRLGDPLPAALARRAATPAVGLVAAIRLGDLLYGPFVERFEFVFPQLPSGGIRLESGPIRTKRGLGRVR